MKLGEIIRAKRKSAKISQIDLAAQAGIAVNSLRLYEAGKRMPKLDTLSKIAAVLGEDINSFLIGTISAEDIANELDMPISLVEDALNNSDSVAADIKSKILYVALSLALELSYRPKNLEDLYSSALDRISQITPEGILASAGDSLKDMSVHISPDSVARAAEEVFYQQANKSLTVEEIKNAFRGKSIEELSEILAAVSKEISEQAAHVSSSND